MILVLLLYYHIGIKKKSNRTSQLIQTVRHFFFKLYTLLGMQANVYNAQHHLQVIHNAIFSKLENKREDTTMPLLSIIGTNDSSSAWRTSGSWRFGRITRGTFWTCSSSSTVSIKQSNIWNMIWQVKMRSGLVVKGQDQVWNLDLELENLGNEEVPFLAVARMPE